MGKLSRIFKVFIGCLILFVSLLVIIVSPSATANDYADKYPANFRLSEDISRLSNWIKPRYYYQMSLRWSGIPGATGYEIEMYSSHWLSRDAYGNYSGLGPGFRTTRKTGTAVSFETFLTGEKDREYDIEELRQEAWWRKIVRATTSQRISVRGRTLFGWNPYSGGPGKPFSNWSSYGYTEYEEEEEKGNHGQPKDEKASAGGDPINLTNGNLFSTTPEFSISTRGLPLEVSRTYNSRSTYNGPLGYGWTHSFNLTLEEDPYNPENGVWYYLFLRRGDGRALYFQRLMDGSFIGPRGDFSTLVEETDGSYLLQEKHGVLSQFNAEGKIVSMSDRRGNETTFTYDAEGRLIEVIGPAGRVISLSYNVNSKISQIIDPAGRTYSYTYDAEDNLIQATDPLGQITSYNYDENHNLTSITYPDGTHTYFSYDDNDRATATWNDGDNQKVNLVYDTENRATQITDALGRTTTYIYNYDHQITAIIDPEGSETKYVYDGANLTCTSITNALGRILQFSYDEKGNLLSSVDALGNTTTYTYEPNYNFCTGIIDPLGQTTNFIYDAAGNLIETVDALGNSSHFSYDTYGELISFTNPKGLSTQYGYDTYGNLLQVTDALGNIQEMSYDILGNCLSIKDRRANITQYNYDLLNRLTQHILPDGKTINYTYDPVGNCTSVTNQLGETYTYQYDAVDRLTGLTDSLGNITAFSYDLVGNRTAITDAQGKITNFSYDSLNRLIKETSPLGNETSYLYDVLGNVILLTQAGGQEINYQYDENNRLIQITYPDGETIYYLYNATGQCIEITSSGGEIDTFSYDALGRLLQLDRGNGGDSISYAYDSLGSRLAMIDQNNGQTLYQYDVLGRLVELSNPEGEITQYIYDAEGNVIELSRANGSRTIYTYDNLNQLVKLENLSSSDQLLSSFQYEYDAAGRKIKEIDSDGATIAYTYDSSGRLIEERKYEIVDEEEREIYARIYTLDELGNVLEETSHQGELKEEEGGWTWLKGNNSAFTFASLVFKKNYLLLASNSLNFSWRNKKRPLLRIIENYREKVRRLCRKIKEISKRPNQRHCKIKKARRAWKKYRHYCWEKRWWRRFWKGKKKDIWEITKTKTSYIYDAENRLLSYEEISLDTDELLSTGQYNYDANGNRFEKIKEIYGQGDSGSEKAIETWVYQYDYENRLKNVLKNGEAVANYFYDALGKRIQAEEGGEINKFYYDGLLAILERDSDGEVVSFYTRGLDLGGGIGGIISTKNLHLVGASFFHYDSRGNVIELSDEAGVSQASYSYDTYGNEVSRSNGEDNPYRFSTKEYSALTGLVYFGARYYDPEAGRFLTRDPLGFTGGINQYLYCASDPVNFNDPYGLLTVIIHGLGKHDEGYSKRLAEVLRSQGETVIEYQWPGHLATHDILVKNLTAQMKNYEQLARSLGENFNVVSHSWGSVLGYESIAKSGANVDNFITMGSPLIGSWPKPENVNFWKNFISYRDPISLLSKFCQADEIHTSFHVSHFGYWNDSSIISDISNILIDNEDFVVQKKPK